MCTDVRSSITHSDKRWEQTECPLIDEGAFAQWPAVSSPVAGAKYRATLQGGGPPAGRRVLRLHFDEASSSCDAESTLVARARVGQGWNAARGVWDFFWGGNVPGPGRSDSCTTLGML